MVLVLGVFGILVLGVMVDSDFAEATSDREAMVFWWSGVGVFLGSANIFLPVFIQKIQSLAQFLASPAELGLSSRSQPIEL